MKTTTLRIKVDPELKEKAQYVAAELGLPLNVLISSYLAEVAETGQINFIAPEVITRKMEKIIEQANKEIAQGEISGPFKSTEEAITYLEKLS